MSKYKIAPTAMMLILLVFSCGCSNSSSEASSKNPQENLSSSKTIPQSLPATEAVSGKSESASEQKENSDGQDKSSPFDPALIAKVRKEAQTFWDDRFIQCGTSKRTGADRWFSVKETEDGKTYLEVIKLRQITSLPYRLNKADEYNDESQAVSIVRGAVWRWCNKEPCDKYDGGVHVLSDLPLSFITMIAFNAEAFESGLFTLRISIERGKLTLSGSEGTKHLYAPTCEEIKKQPIWKEN